MILNLQSLNSKHFMYFWKGQSFILICFFILKGHHNYFGGLRVFYMYHLVLFKLIKMQFEFEVVL
jgi:hypothetical protein